MQHQEQMDAATAASSPSSNALGSLQQRIAGVVQSVTKSATSREESIGDDAHEGTTDGSGGLSVGDLDLSDFDSSDGSSSSSHKRLGASDDEISDNDNDSDLSSLSNSSRNMSTDHVNEEEESKSQHEIDLCASAPDSNEKQGHTSTADAVDESHDSISSTHMETDVSVRSINASLPAANVRVVDVGRGHMDDTALLRNDKADGGGLKSVPTHSISNQSNEPETGHKLFAIDVLFESHSANLKQVFIKRCSRGPKYGMSFNDFVGLCKTSSIVPHILQPQHALAIMQRRMSNSVASSAASSPTNQHSAKSNSRPRQRTGMRFSSFIDCIKGLGEYMFLHQNDQNSHAATGASKANNLSPTEAAASLLMLLETSTNTGSATNSTHRTPAHSRSTSPKFGNSNSSSRASTNPPTPMPGGRAEHAQFGTNGERDDSSCLPGQEHHWAGRESLWKVGMAAMQSAARRPAHDYGGKRNSINCGVTSSWSTATTPNRLHSAGINTPRNLWGSQQKQQQQQRQNQQLGQGGLMQNGNTVLQRMELAEHARAARLKRLREEQYSRETQHDKHSQGIPRINRASRLLAANARHKHNNKNTSKNKSRGKTSASVVIADISPLNKSPVNHSASTERYTNNGIRSAGDKDREKHDNEEENDEVYDRLYRSKEEYRNKYAKRIEAMTMRDPHTGQLLFHPKLVSRFEKLTKTEEDEAQGHLRTGTNNIREALYRNAALREIRRSKAAKVADEQYARERSAVRVNPKSDQYVAKKIERVVTELFLRYAEAANQNRQQQQQYHDGTGEATDDDGDGEGLLCATRDADAVGRDDVFDTDVEEEVAESFEEGFDIENLFNLRPAAHLTLLSNDTADGDSVASEPEPSLKLTQPAFALYDNDSKGEEEVNTDDNMSPPPPPPPPHRLQQHEVQQQQQQQQQQVPSELRLPFRSLGDLLRDMNLFYPGDSLSLPDQYRQIEHNLQLQLWSELIRASSVSSNRSNRETQHVSDIPRWSTMSFIGIGVEPLVQFFLKVVYPHMQYPVGAPNLDNTESVVNDPQIQSELAAREALFREFRIRYSTLKTSSKSLLGGMYHPQQQSIASTYVSNGSESEWPSTSGVNRSISRHKEEKDGKNENEGLFKPKINKRSRALDAAKYNNIEQRNRVEIILEKHSENQRRIEKLREQQEDQSLNECTFHPELISEPRWLLSKRNPPGYPHQHSQYTIDTHPRVIEGRTTEQIEFEEYCTFQPTVVSTRKPDGSSNAVNAKRMSGAIAKASDNSPVPKAYVKSIERLRKGRALQQEKKRALAVGSTNRGTLRWSAVHRDNKGAIIPEPFHLHTQNRDRQQTLKDATRASTVSSTSRARSIKTQAVVGRSMLKTGGTSVPRSAVARGNTTTESLNVTPPPPPPPPLRSLVSPRRLAVSERSPRAQQLKNSIETHTQANSPRQSPSANQGDLKPLMYVDVSISQDNVKRIALFEHDSPPLVAQRFAREFNLNSGMAKRLEALLEAQLYMALDSRDTEIAPATVQAPTPSSKASATEEVRTTSKEAATARSSRAEVTSVNSSSTLGTTKPRATAAARLSAFSSPTRGQTQTQRTVGQGDMPSTVRASSKTGVHTRFPNAVNSSKSSSSRKTESGSESSATSTSSDDSSSDSSGSNSSDCSSGSSGSSSGSGETGDDESSSDDNDDDKHSTK